MNKRSILLVEDNPDDLELTMRALRRDGIVNEIVIARDGVQAIKYLFEGKGAHDPPVLTMLDLKLPRVDGLEFLRRIRQEEMTRLLPVVVFTSSNEETDLVESYKLGANSYIRKPVDFIEFAQAVKQLHLYWLLLNQSPPVPNIGRPL
ncbi:MAG: response regulator [bacterium]